MNLKLYNYNTTRIYCENVNTVICEENALHFVDSEPVIVGLITC